MNSVSSGSLLNMIGLLGRTRIYSILAVLLALLLLVQVIRLIWLVATPLGPVGDWGANEVDVLPPQSRLALFSSFDPFFRSAPAASGNVITSLQLTLFGTRMNQGSGLGSAILAGPDGVQDSYAIGEEVMSGVTLASVHFDYVTIDRSGVKESLYLDQSVPAETVGADIMTTPLASGLSASTALDKAVSFQARSEDGEVTGVIISSKGDGALFQAAGFQDGDVITSVNGKAVSSAADIEAIKGQLSPGSRLSVQVERGENVVPISVNLVGK